MYQGSLVNCLSYRIEVERYKRHKSIKSLVSENLSGWLLLDLSELVCCLQLAWLRMGLTVSKFDVGLFAYAREIRSQLPTAYLLIQCVC